MLGAGVKIATVRIYFEGLGVGMGLNEDIVKLSNVGPTQQTAPISSFMDLH
jgi:hypothetical protein